jgi:hypothetical protein
MLDKILSQVQMLIAPLNQLVCLEKWFDPIRISSGFNTIGNIVKFKGFRVKYEAHISSSNRGTNGGGYASPWRGGAGVCGI